MIARKYAAIPYLDGGRSAVPVCSGSGFESTGLDCWGLVRLVLMHEYGVPDLPEWGRIFDKQPDRFDAAFQKMRGAFYCVDQPESADVVCVFNAEGLCAHVGIIIPGDTGPTVLDTTPKNGVQTCDLRNYARKYDNRIEFWRYARY